MGSLPQSPPSSSYATSLSITTIAVSSAAGSTWSPSYSSTYYNGLGYTPNKISLYESSPSSKSLFLSADSGSGGILLAYYAIASSISSYIY